MSKSKKIAINNENAIVVDEGYEVQLEKDWSFIHDVTFAVLELVNLTDRPFRLNDGLVEPIFQTEDKSIRRTCGELGIDMALTKEKRPSLTFEELPQPRDGYAYVVEPEVAARGIEEGRADLVALPRPCAELGSDEIEQFNLVNISDIPVIYGSGEDNGYIINPDPDIHPYSVMIPLGGCDVSDDVHVYGDEYLDPYQAVLGLPPRKDGTLYLARSGIAILSHIGERFDIVGGIVGMDPSVSV